VYVNTFVLAEMLDMHVKPFKTAFFTWSDIIPADLETVMAKGDYDVIYCFSSTDKEDYFRSKVSKIIAAKGLGYSITSPPQFGEPPGIEYDIPYSNFSLKYLFLEDKININWIHKFCCHFFRCQGRGDDNNNPYITKLAGLLLSRGYQTIQLDTDIQDESKGLLRKLLYEEYKFKFRIVPKQSVDLANSTLVIGSKSGQQAYEEIKRQENAKENKIAGSHNKTFVVPDRIKYTSKTKLIGIYRNENRTDTKSKALMAIRSSLHKISNLIFETTALKNEKLYNEMFGKLEDKFILKNIIYIVEKLRSKPGEWESEYDKLVWTNGFLRSFQHYEIHDSKIKDEFKKIVNSDTSEKDYKDSKLVKIIVEKMSYLQLKGYKEFTECLEDHHVSEKEEIMPISYPRNLKSKYLGFFRKVLTYSGSLEMMKDPRDVTEDENEKMKEARDKIRRTFLDGFFLISLILECPNGFPEKDWNGTKDLSEKFIRELGEKRKRFEKEVDESDTDLDTDELFNYYNLLKILAEDLNFFIADEALLCDPKIILSALKDFDISEFECLYSIEFAQYYKTNPALKS
jgi:hypothetical protein